MAVNLYLAEERDKSDGGGGGGGQWQSCAVEVDYPRSHLTRVFVNKGSSAMGGTAESIRGWDLMKDRVSSGKSMEVL